MLRFLLGRVVWAATLVVSVSIVMFVLFFLVPGPDLSVSRDLATAANAASSTAAPRGSAVGEYLGFLHHLVRGDLGRSRNTHVAVGQLVGEAIPATASLVLGGIVVWVLLALAIGTWSALHPRSLGDRVGTGFVLLGVSAHPLWLSLITAWLFGHKLRWFPLQGYCDMFHPSLGSGCGGPVQWTYHLVLPWLVFGAGFAALYARMTRATLLEVMHEDYVRTARAKGLSSWRVLRRHAFRNAAAPLAMMLTMDVGLAFGGTMFVERVFDIPGLGRLALSAIPRRDLPVLLGVVITVSLVTVAAALLLDIVLGLVDPRVSGLLPHRSAKAAPVKAELRRTRAATQPR